MFEFLGFFFNLFYPHWFGILTVRQDTLMIEYYKSIVNGEYARSLKK